MALSNYNIILANLGVGAAWTDCHITLCNQGIGTCDSVQLHYATGVLVKAVLVDSRIILRDQGVGTCGSVRLQYYTWQPGCWQKQLGPIAILYSAMESWHKRTILYSPTEVLAHSILGQDMAHVIFTNWAYIGSHRVQASSFRLSIVLLSLHKHKTDHIPRLTEDTGVYTNDCIYACALWIYSLPFYRNEAKIFCHVVKFVTSV